MDVDRQFYPDRLASETGGIVRLILRPGSREAKPQQ